MGTLHQILAGAAAGDAITDHAFLIQRWLREAGHDSTIYTPHVDDNLRGKIQPLSRYRRSVAESHLIYHHSLGFDAISTLDTPPLLLVHHNITPPEFFVGVEPMTAEKMQLGYTQLAELAPRTALAVADSAFNEQDLIEAGFKDTGVLSIAFDPGGYDRPVNPTLQAHLATLGPKLLFVGRLVPNKRQEDIVKLFYAYRQIQPTARLFLIGGSWTDDYAAWIRTFVEELGLVGAVTFTGKISYDDLYTYYRSADLYVSMSEHEGFGKPLIESMFFDLPIMAYAATAVPETMGNAGVLFHRKAYVALAELADILIHDQALRTQIIRTQRKRIEHFLEPVIHQQWLSILARLWG